LTSFAKPKWNQELVWREAEGEVFVCSADGQTLFTLDAVGADIWRACDGKHTIDQITSWLLESYEVDRITIEKDLRACLENLLDRELIFLLIK
jgi:monomeric isocitrate dehydrogenase